MRLEFLPVIYITATSDQAVLVEGFAHAHMTAFERVGHAEQVELEYLSLNPRP